MFSNIRKRLTYTNVLMTLALVFAMSGGAYAANHYLITSTKQISPKVLKALKGAKGANGANGGAGLAGAQGSQGPQGAAGPQGPTGEAGAAGNNGTNGTNGTNGKEGAPWTAGGTLPEGATETGMWTLWTTAAKTEEPRTTAISFPIPLAQAPEGNVAKLGETAKAPCKGNVEKPETETPAKGGRPILCVFEGDTVETLPPKGLTLFAGLWHIGAPGGAGAGTTGANLVFLTTETGEVRAEGTFAVTG